jgi:hypothetical protein
MRHHTLTVAHAWLVGQSADRQGCCPAVKPRTGQTVCSGLGCTSHRDQSRTCLSWPSIQARRASTHFRSVANLSSYPAATVGYEPADQMMPSGTYLAEMEGNHGLGQGGLSMMSRPCTSWQAGMCRCTLYSFHQWGRPRFVGPIAGCCICCQVCCRSV